MGFGGFVASVNVDALIVAAAVAGLERRALKTGETSFVAVATAGDTAVVVVGFQTVVVVAFGMLRKIVGCTGSGVVGAACAVVQSIVVWAVAAVVGQIGVAAAAVAVAVVVVAAAAAAAAVVAAAAAPVVVAEACVESAVVQAFAGCGRISIGVALAQATLDPAQRCPTSAETALSLLLDGVHSRGWRLPQSNHWSGLSGAQHLRAVSVAHSTFLFAGRRLLSIRALQMRSAWTPLSSFVFGVPVAFVELCVPSRNLRWLSTSRLSSWPVEVPNPHFGDQLTVLHWNRT